MLIANLLIREKALRARQRHEPFGNKSENGKISFEVVMNLERGWHGERRGGGRGEIWMWVLRKWNQGPEYNIFS